MKKVLIFLFATMFVACTVVPGSGGDGNDGNGDGDGNGSGGGPAGIPSGFVSAKEYYDLKPGAENLAKALHTINETVRNDDSKSKKIYLEPGVYTLEADLVGGTDGINAGSSTTVYGLANVDGLTLVGDATGLTVIRGAGDSPSHMVFDGPKNLTISNIVFENVHVYVKARNNSSVCAKNVTFAGNIFYGSKYQGTDNDQNYEIIAALNKKDEFGFQLVFGFYNPTTTGDDSAVKTLNISENIFLLNDSLSAKYTDGNMGIGKAIGLYGVQDADIVSNIIGLDMAELSSVKSRYTSTALQNALNKLDDLEITGKHSYYGSAIRQNSKGASVGAYNQRVLIADNYMSGIYNSTTPVDTQVNNAVHLIDLQDSAIVGNYFTGWGKDHVKSTIYLYDGKDVVIAKNFFEDGNIMLERRSSGNGALKNLINIWVDENYFNVEAAPLTGSQFLNFGLHVKVNGSWGDYSADMSFVVANNEWSASAYPTLDQTLTTDGGYTRDVGFYNANSDISGQKTIFNNNITPDGKAKVNSKGVVSEPSEGDVPADKPSMYSKVADYTRPTKL